MERECINASLKKCIHNMVIVIHEQRNGGFHLVVCNLRIISSLILASLSKSSFDL